MEPVIETLLAELSRQHDMLKETWKDASQEAIDWKPGPDTNSLGVLAIHVAGAERFWIGDLTTGRPSLRDRDAEFLVSGLPASELDAALDSALDDSTAALAGLSVNDLLEMRHVARYNRDQSVLRNILHAISHVGLHVGHAQLTRQLFEQQRAS